VVIAMKIEIPILAALLVLATELMARAALQGFEQALVSTLVEWSARRMRVARRKFWRGRQSMSLCVRKKS
jgi:type IV secretory pathway VirB3-like protein